MKGKRKSLGEFSVGDRIVWNGENGIIESFPSRRDAVIAVEGVLRKVSVWDIEKAKK